MTASALFLKYGNRFLLGYPFCLVWVMLDCKTDKWFSDNQTDIKRLAGMFTGRSAWACHGHYLVRIFQDNVARSGVGHYFFKIGHGNGQVNRNKLPGTLKGYHLAMIRIGESDTTAVFLDSGYQPINPDNCICHRF